MDVGIRELKAHLSEMLDRAARGEDVVVTDRGRPIVRLVPFSSSSVIERGIDEGWVEEARRSRLDPVQRVRSATSVLEALDEDRG